MADKNKLYQEFLEHYPKDKLATMTLDEYTNLVPNESFCNWLESRTEELGSIWGRPSYKFGIFRMKGQPKENSKYQHDDKYAWWSRYGAADAQRAFEIVRDSIVEIAESASKHDLQAIDEIDILNGMFKWKIAYMYSDKWIIPIYSDKWLRTLCQHYGMPKSSEANTAKLQQFLIERRGDADPFEYYQSLLDTYYSLNEESNDSCDFTDTEQIQIADTGMKQYWWLLANPKIYSFSEMALGGTQEWTLYNDNRAKRRIFQNYLDAKAGDVVFCYQATPTLQIVALAEVSRENNGETIEFKKVENLLTPIDYAEIKKNEALADMEFIKNPNGSFFKVTLDEAAELMEMIRADNPIKQEAPKYTKEDFLTEVYMSDANYERLRTLLETKRNIILQGAPGVGKTFSAKRLAYSILGQEDDSHVEVIQFHQNYSYEDFIMGYKPTEDGGFELKKGIFYAFCKKAAADDPKEKYFFIIDEINRGNLSKIFGELLMLIENEYRGKEIRLAYNGELFSVPKNVYIIGMMNTADRSLAMIDYALRRRFSFFEITPGFESDGFKTLLESTGNDRFNKLIDAVKALNEQITKDNSLGSGFCIGHSYFCEPKGDIEQWLLNIIDYDIDPMLKEYWFDNEDKYKSEIAKLRSII